MEEIKQSIAEYEYMMIDNINKQKQIYELLNTQRELLKNECGKNGHNFIHEIYYDGHNNQHTYKCSICNYIQD